MENPCLTFITPTLLAGDRSLVDVVAHEISHSWTGNLVTTLNWVIHLINYQKEGKIELTIDDNYSGTFLAQRRMDQIS